MENEQSNPVVLRSPSQEVLVVGLFKSRKLRDKEYQKLRSIWEFQVVTIKDAFIFINKVLADFRFTEMFLSEKFRSFKRCFYCEIRDNIARVEYVKTGIRHWSCETCLLNLDSNEFVLVPRKSNNGN